MWSVILGSLRNGLCCWPDGQLTRHLRRIALHENADRHQSLHSEFGRGRRMFPHRHPFHHDDNGLGVLAVWQRNVQGE